MKWKIRKLKGNFILLFIDKIILAGVAIAALVILFIFVVGKPNAIEHVGKKFSPNQLIEYINNRSGKLQEKLKETPQDSNSYKPQEPKYLDVLRDSIQGVDTNIDFPLPRYLAEAKEKPVYSLPAINKVEKPSIIVVPMAAFVPTEKLSETTSYANAKTELADVDLVTVESSIDVKKLYEDFKTAFTGRHLPIEWRIKDYAKPVFAKVELQRRTLQKDGSWNQWEKIPKTKLYHLDKVLQIPEEPDEYKIQIALVQFEKPESRKEILQPDVYFNAIPSKQWVSPSFYKEREQQFAREQEELERRRIEAERAERLRSRSSSTRTTRRQPGVSDEAEEELVRPLPGRTRRPAEELIRRPGLGTTEPTTVTIESQFNAIRLTKETELENLEKLIFWAHDETTKPGDTYQYRIRLGVFNPIAGKDWFSEDQKDLQKQAVLYSDFSEPTEAVEIPHRIHFFAVSSRDIKRSNFVDKTVDIKVARYTLGNWVTKTFTVRSGDEIGAVIDIADTRLRDTDIPVESIDLSTGFVMVDTRTVTKWTGTSYLRPREFHELLYCKSGEPIQNTPIKSTFWPEETVQIYKKIEDAEARELVILNTKGGPTTTSTEFGRSLTPNPYE
ncbi:MAG: hypothetical protein JW806_07660 [Sedimentisphaerales bacterium]|nr:hypothetical protein [Sedimentisphaerales bacterium]